MHQNSWKNINMYIVNYLVEKPCRILTVPFSQYGDYMGKYTDQQSITCLDGYVVQGTCNTNIVCNTSYESVCTSNGHWSVNTPCTGKWTWLINADPYIHSKNEFVKYTNRQNICKIFN